MKTIAQLKAEGYEVRITHLRSVPWMPDNLLIPGYIARKLGLLINPRGGITIAEVRKSVGPVTTSLVGIARVHNKDNYNYKRGVQIALSRACANL